MYNELNERETKMPKRSVTNKRMAAIVEYNKRTYKQFKFNANMETEGDLIAYIESLDNKNAYIKNLIRQDMEKKKGSE